MVRSRPPAGACASTDGGATPAEPTLQAFEAVVGEAFRVDLGAAGELELVLDEAEGGEGTTVSGRDPFRLLFRGPADPALAQQTLRLEHPSLGALEIFLVPVGRNAEGTTYEAIFA